MPNFAETRTGRDALTIAVLTDLHYGEAPPGSKRRGGIADILLERAVRRLNGLVRPDVVLVLGDLVDDGNAPGAADRLRTLRGILDKLDAPYLAVPGNHDGNPDRFYEVFDRPRAVEDIGGVRFLAFVDREEPGYNATRSAVDLERIRAARADYDGPLVSLQHVCLFPPGPALAPYNYTNAGEVVEALRAAGAVLSVSGHHHRGAEPVTEGGVTYVNAPGLCETPFPFLEITLDGGKAETRRHELAMPAALRLVDHHVHTELAYCSENMTVERSIALARDFGLAGLTFNEHSGQLYFDRKTYWGKQCLREGVAAARAADNRMPSYLERQRAYQDDYARFGLEADADYRGGLLLKPADRAHFDRITGAVHGLPGLTKEAPPGKRDEEDFLRLVGGLCRNGIDALAHPLRVFRRSGWPTPPALYEPTARLLHEHGVAAEINFHSNEPPVEFIRICLRMGVRFSFGSDAHNLAEIGDFARHLALLREAGFDGDLADVLAIG